MMAVKWHKERFWTVAVYEDGVMNAFRQNGFSDGQYNYCKTVDEKWYAVLPDCGLSVAAGETRAKCRAAALKATVPSEDEMSDGQKALYKEAKRLIYEKTAFRL